jgi:hypothetical protein
MDPKNGEQPAYVRSAALRGAAVLLQELGVDGVVLARECGLDAAALDNSDLPVPGAAVVAFFEAAADRSGREDFGLLLAARQDLSVLGPVWEAMRSAGTVLDALCRCCRTSSSCTPTAPSSAYNVLPRVPPC